MSKRKPRVWPPVPEPLAAPVMDNHTHLPVVEEEIPRADGIRLSLGEQLARAKNVGVTSLVTSACALPDFAPTLQIAQAHTEVNVGVALALHPNEAPLHEGINNPSPDGLTPEIEDYHIPLDEALGKLDTYLSDPKVVAVGETGLDYFRTSTEGRQSQTTSFREHLRLAREYGLPLQIHDRDAHADTLAVLKSNASPDQTIVFHCYSGDKEMAGILADAGWYASFAGNCTYPTNENLRVALASLPKELVLVETDAPYLTPIPWRGHPNASYLIAHTVRAIAAIWNMSEAQTCHQLAQNSADAYPKMSQI